MGEVYAVGVGPGSPRYITDVVKEVILYSDIVIGYKYTLQTIERLLANKEVYEITMQNQEEVYQKVAKSLGDKTCAVPFTGDVSFSESEVVDRLIEIFGDVEIVPGISSIQVAASKSKVPIDKSTLITFHITGSIESEKKVLLEAIKNDRNVIMLPRPWDFMPVNVAEFLEQNSIDLSEFNVDIYEFLTLSNERVTKTNMGEIPKREYSDLCVMVIHR